MIENMLFCCRAPHWCGGLQVQGTGFLYKMVRHLAGTLLAVGEGKLSLQEVQRRIELGSSAPPGGASGCAAGGPEGGRRYLPQGAMIEPGWAYLRCKCWCAVATRAAPWKCDSTTRVSVEQAVSTLGCRCCVQVVLAVKHQAITAGCTTRLPLHNQSFKVDGARAVLPRACLPAGEDGSYRGYNVAPSRGLCLVHVAYPPEVDDPQTLLYPGQPHDEFGRLLAHVPEEELRRSRAEARATVAAAAAGPAGCGGGGGAGTAKGSSVGVGGGQGAGAGAGVEVPLCA